MKILAINILLFLNSYVYAQEKVTPNSSASFSAAGIQKKINLDDIQIKGESQNKGLSVLARQRNSLEGRITMRKNYHDEILAELPIGYVPILSVKPNTGQ